MVSSWSQIGFTEIQILGMQANTFALVAGAAVLFVFFKYSGMEFVRLRPMSKRGRAIPIYDMGVYYRGGIPEIDQQPGFLESNCTVRLYENRIDLNIHHRGTAKNTCLQVGISDIYHAEFTTENDHQLLLLNFRRNSGPVHLHLALYNSEQLTSALAPLLGANLSAAKS